MATIRETILKVKPGKQKIIPLSEVDVTGYRQQAHVISKELRDKGIVVPDGKPAYTISKNKYTGSMYIISTINNQLQKAFEVLNVKNGRELATMLYERVTGMKLTMNFSPITRSVVACCLLCVFSLSLYHEQGEMRRERKSRIERIERIRRVE